MICDGEVIYADGRFTKVDRDGALRALHDDLSKALADDEVERRKLSKALLPHVKAFYANYFDPAHMRHSTGRVPASDRRERMADYDLVIRGGTVVTAADTYPRRCRRARRPHRRDRREAGGHATRWMPAGCS